MITADVEKNASKLPIRFEIPAHWFLSSDFTTTTQTIETIIQEINKRLFSQGIDYELIVFPSETGSFKAVYGIVVNALQVTAVVGGLVGFAETETVKGVIEGLTGHQLNYHEAGEAIGLGLKDMVVGILTTETEQLHKIIPHEINLDKALYAKSKFYNMCLNNTAMASVDFVDEDVSIKRERFIYHTSNDLGSGPIEMFTNQMITDSILLLATGGTDEWAVLVERSAMDETGTAATT